MKILTLFKYCDILVFYMKVKPFGNKDIFRVVFTLILTFLVAVFVAPVAPWILSLTIGVLIYTLSLELLKFYLGLKNLRKKKFKIATIQDV